jgi:PAS domain S-box-containing protein
MASNAMLASTTDCVKLVALDGTIEYINPSGLALLEFGTEPAPVGRSWASLWPDDARRVAEAALKASAAGEVARFTELRATRQGVAKWWDVAVSPVCDGDGSIVRHLCVSRDVTAQKAIEHSLSSSEQRFRALADNMAQLAWMADISGRAFWYNKRWIEYTGVTADDGAGFGWRTVHHPDTRKAIVERIDDALANQDMWEHELRVRAADGSYRWFLSRAVPVCDGEGRAVLWCATYTDVTEQRAMSERLRQLARVIELSHEAILVWSLEEGIMLWNKGCEELYGYRRTEVLGLQTHDLLFTPPADDLEVRRQRLMRDLQWSGEIVHRAKDGSEVWVDSRQEVIRAGGRDLVLETNRDITDRRNADALRDLLVAELNHRVKNTLAIVQSLAAQTARTQQDMPSFVASFTGRLQSLGVAQAVLSDAHWAGASLADLVRSQLAITVGPSEQIVVSGEDLSLLPPTALQLTLILHELATNARRYGALSTPHGRVDIRWHAKPDATGEAEIVWRESGGPPVERPRVEGLGRKLIERTGQLPHLKSQLEFLADGVRCCITVTLARLDRSAMPYFNPRSQRVEAPEQRPRPKRPE